MFLHVRTPSEDICLVQLPSLPERTRDELLKVTSGRTLCSDRPEVHHAVWTWAAGAAQDWWGALVLSYSLHTQGAVGCGACPRACLHPLLWPRHRAPFPRGAENSQAGAFSPIFPGGTHDSPSLLLQESPCFSRITRFPEPVQAKSPALGFSLSP